MRRNILFVILFWCLFFVLPAGVAYAQYPTKNLSIDCVCSSTGNCSDPDPTKGLNCSTGATLACGVQCPPGYKNVEMWCGGTQSCGGKCIYEQSCVTGFCGGASCDNFDGDFLCGGGGCDGCSRFVRETICGTPGSQCQVWCSPDPLCNSTCPGNGGPGGATNTPRPPGGPTDTPIPTVTPIPIGTIRARAVQVDPADTSCIAIRAVPTTDAQITGTTIGFTVGSADQPPPQTQSGANYVTFASEPGGTYTVDPAVPSGNWVLAGYCWSNSNGTPPSTGASSTLGDGETLTWDIGYTLGTGWVQTEGGDAYASGTIKSYIPAVVPRVFSTVGSGGSPGIVTYGTTYDFDGQSVSQGGTYVSVAKDGTTPVNWLVNATRTTVDYYDYFYNRFGKPSTTDNAIFIY